jgi:hypothetical protein
MRNVLTKFVEKMKTYFGSVLFENRVVCQIMWKCNLGLGLPRCACNNKVEYNRGQNVTSILAGYSFGGNKQLVSAYSEAIIRFTNVSYTKVKQSRYRPREAQRVPGS